MSSSSSGVKLIGKKSANIKDLIDLTETTEATASDDASSNHHRISLRSAATPGRPRGATYDGNLCLICGDRASGLHYGVLACEGCKGFFKRVCKEIDDQAASAAATTTAAALTSKRHCVFGGCCEINVKTRNRCQYCRINKCIELGMSKDGIKLGRRSKMFKQSHLNSANNNNNNNNKRNKQTVLPPSSSASLSSSSSYSSSSSSSSSFLISSPPNNAQFIQLQLPHHVSAVVTSISSTCDKNNNYESQPLQFDEIIETIDQAFNVTKFDYEPLPATTTSTSSSSDEFKRLFSNGILQFLRDTKFLDHFNLLIENAVLFAKNAPYFMTINESDRISLLKSCIFKIICVRHAFMFKQNGDGNEDVDGDGDDDKLPLTTTSTNNKLYDLATLASCALNSNNKRNRNESSNRKSSAFLRIPVYNASITCEELNELLPKLSRLLTLWFDFLRHFHQLDLNDKETALFCAHLLFKTDDDDDNQQHHQQEQPNNLIVVDQAKVAMYKEFYSQLFVNYSIKNAHQQQPLNTRRNRYLDLEESQSQSESQQSTMKKTREEVVSRWLNDCCSKLTQIDAEHATLLNEYKTFIQFPDLYSELYNL